MLDAFENRFPTWEDLQIRFVDKPYEFKPINPMNLISGKATFSYIITLFFKFEYSFPGWIVSFSESDYKLHNFMINSKVYIYTITKPNLQKNVIIIISNNNNHLYHMKIASI